MFKRKIVEMSKRFDEQYPHLTFATEVDCPCCGKKLVIKPIGVRAGGGSKGLGLYLAAVSEC